MDIKTGMLKQFESSS